MHVRFLLGPAGSGKTSRCLQEIRAVLSQAPEGLPLILLAPNQTTYQLERLLLAGPGVEGYSRLHILSFERLAYLLFEWLRKPCPELLDEEGRIMVLRALLARKHKELRLFRASARLTGFARQLSRVLREFQQHGLTPDSLVQIAGQAAVQQSLAFKLHDFAALLSEYEDWLGSHTLQDADSLLSNATRLLAPSAEGNAPRARLELEGLWVDGFAEFTAQELDLLAALLPSCRNGATLTFCLEDLPGRQRSWLSSWSISRHCYEACHKRLSLVPGCDLVIERLTRDPQKGRFSGSPVLRHLEEHWAAPRAIPSDVPALETAQSLRVAACNDTLAEVTLAAREILTHVRAGGRYRDVTVLVRNLEGYHHQIQRVFAQYEIPLFLDRREAMAHHPVAELTRSALRTVALGWQHEDWFAALKTGLAPAEDEEIDELENEALARGWRGASWQQPLRILEAGRTPEEDQRLRRLEGRLEDLRQKLVSPFQRLALALRLADNKPTGAQLAEALREFWELLDVAGQIERWPGRGQDLDAETSGSVHETVWTQMNSWLENIELAFASEPLPLREWLPILEAGLANLTVGLIPPALDQVLAGAVDRSRNPDIALAIILGMNESVFPVPPDPGVLLTDTEREELEKRNAMPASSARQHLSRERFYAYIACTRARRRLVLTYAQRDADGKVLNPSPFVAQIRQLFPAVNVEPPGQRSGWEDCLHSVELIEALVSSVGRSGSPLALRAWSSMLKDWDIPGMTFVAAALDHFQLAQALGSDQALSPEMAARLYGAVLRTSVSRMEQFAACPFRFFVHSGMRAQERKEFELDSREQGTFQHDVLALFHEQLRREKKRWRDITPEEARDRVAGIAAALAESYREGLLAKTEQTRFMTRVLTQSLREFVEILVTWMRGQYEFDPVAVELPFGPDEESPGWSIALEHGRKLELYGRIDRVDLLPKPGSDEALCVVVDYKSSQKLLDPVLMAQGLQLQLLAYLNVLQHWPRPAEVFGVSRLVPAGVFYVNLRGKSSLESNRVEALEATEQGRRLAYRHSGRFDAAILPRLDSRQPPVTAGDQFNYRRNKDGSLNKGCREPVASAGFAAMLESVEGMLRSMGSQVYAGVADVSPFRKGSLVACDQCKYQSICRVDPWTQRYRLLKPDDTSPP